MKPRKALILHTILSSHYKAKVFSELYPICKNDGIELSVLHLAVNWRGGPKFGLSDREIHRYPHKLLFDRNIEEIGLLERTSRQLREVADFKPDVLVLSGYSDPAAWFVLFFSKLLFRPKVIVVSDSTEKDHPRVYWKELLKRPFMWLCDGAFCYGTAAASYVRKLGMRKEGVFIRYQATDNKVIKEAFEAAKRNLPQFKKEYNTREKNFIYVGRFSPEKNLFCLLNAYVNLQAIEPSAGDWGLILVGDGPQRRELAGFVRDNSVKGVVFTGGMSWKEVPAFYAMSDVFVLPSLSEPWGLVVNEAMVCGLPMIVSNRVGASFNLVRDGVNGFKFDPEKSDELCSVMRKFASGEVSPNGMGGKSEEIIKNYSPDIAAFQMLKGIRSVLDETSE